MSVPTARFYIGFGSTWTTPDASISWTEVTSDVLVQHGATVNRGRSSELDEYRAGRCSFTLDNRGRKYDPFYSAGPYYGDLLPGVPVKIEAVANSTTFPVFRGFADGFPQDYPDPSDRVPIVNLSATDGFGKLAQAGTPSSVYALEVEADAPKAWWRLAETAGTSLQDSSGNGYDGYYEPGVTAGSGRSPNEWESTPAVEFDGYGFATVTDAAARIDAVPFVIEFVGKHPYDPAGVLVSAEVVRQGPGTTTTSIVLALRSTDGVLILQSQVAGGAGETIIGTRDNRDGLPHHFAVRRTASDDEIYIDGELETVSTVGFSVVPTDFIRLAGRSGGSTLGDPIGWNGPLADVAFYTADIGTARIEAHAAALAAPWDGDTTGQRTERVLAVGGWPSDLVDVADGFTFLGPASLGENVLALAKSYEKAEQGRFFMSRGGKATFLDRYYHQLVTEGVTAQATFSDDGSDIKYSGIGFDYDTRLVYNRVRGSRLGGAKVETFDQTSIDTYGEQVETSLEGIEVATDAEVRAASEFRLDRYKDPQLRARPLTSDLHRAAAPQQAAVLGLEIGYRINLERRPNATGSTIDQETIVEGITHRIGAGEWSTTVTSSPVDTRVYGLWDTALWDVGLWGY